MHAKAADPQPRAVVELFTSQGCSSCPPADALLAELADRDDVVALAYHVDYWDYLGWKDNLATPENSSRQHAYGAGFDSSVYTPQVVVNGGEHLVGSDREEILDAIRAGTEDTLNIDVELASTNGSVTIRIGAAKASPSSAHILLVYFRPQQVVKVAGGKNKGRSIDYRNIVTNFQTVGMWHGEPIEVELPKSEIRKQGGCYAVLLQNFDERGRPGDILGAAQMTVGGS